MSPRYLTFVIGASLLLSQTVAVAKPPTKTPTQPRASVKNRLQKGQVPKAKPIGVDAKETSNITPIDPAQNPVPDGALYTTSDQAA